MKLVTLFGFQAFAVIERLERLRFTFTPNGKPEFVSRDQVFALFFVYCLLFLDKNK